VTPRPELALKALRALRPLREGMAPAGSARERVLRTIVHALPAGRRLTSAVRPLDIDEQYRLWLEHNALTPERLEELRQEVQLLRFRPTISVVMPVHDTDPALLAAAIESVHEQVYDNWELCIADDASSRSDTREALMRAKGDERVRVTRLETGGGIAVASNAALSLARGAFVAFLDHDDELKPDALLEVAKLLNEQPDLDFVYSDEDKRNPQGELVEPFFKPDWSPDLELSINYVTHLSVYRRELLVQLGGFRTGYDGSQDYDLALRATEASDRIAHIPKLLYTWRMAPGSAAGAANAKPYAHDAARRALRDAVERRSLDAEVLDGPGLGSWRVRRRIPEGLRVEVVRDRARVPEADVLVFLEPGVDGVGDEWLNALAEHAQRAEIGAVGGRILWRDDLAEHEGVVLGLGGSAQATSCRGYFGLGDVVRNVSAVTGCLATRADVFAELGGLDDSYGTLAAVDYCLRAREAGYSILYTPYATLRRVEAAPRVPADERAFRERWVPDALRDPFYNPNLSLVNGFELPIAEDRERPYAALGSGSARARVASSRR
jgi:GT2 family glycosyltransferase